MQDYIVRAIAAEGTVMAFAAVTTNMVEEAIKIHSLSPVACAALGRTMTAAAIMSGLLKGEKDTVTVQIKGGGPLGGIVVISDSKANVRGYLSNPQVDLPLNSLGKFDVADAVGKNGYMNVIKDMGLKEPYIGYVNLVSGEIAEDLVYYFANSEQVPSIVALGVLVNTDGSILEAGGFIIQLMPGAGDDIIDFLETRMGAIPPITKLLSDGKSPEEVLQLIFEGKDLKFLQEAPCRYLCNCSRERMERNIMSMGAKEILDMVEEQHGAETQCHFCNRKYQFSEAELLELVQGNIEE